MGYFIHDQDGNDYAIENDSSIPVPFYPMSENGISTEQAVSVFERLNKQSPCDQMEHKWQYALNNIGYDIG